MVKFFLAVLCAAATVLFSTVASAKPDNNSFLLLSDIHLDPYISCAANDTHCPLIDALRKAPVEEWDTIFEQLDNSQTSTYGEDTNHALFQSTFNYIQKISRPYSFVLITGDTLAHDYYERFQAYTGDTSAEHYQDFVKKTYLYMQNHLQTIAPDKSIYIVLGNNDSYSVSNTVESNGLFYKDMAEVWSKTIFSKTNQASFEKTFPTLGYYEVYIDNNPQNRLIVLNSVAFAVKAKGSGVNAAADEQMQWLNARLKAAQKQNAHVILAYHIPNGIDPFTSYTKQTTAVLWKQRYNSAFFGLLREYSSTLTAVISSHFHSDTFELLPTKDHQVLVNTFASSVSPQHGNNPSFKIMEYNTTTFELTNYQVFTYYLNLVKNQWAKEYDFNNVYQPDCQQCTLVNGYKKIGIIGREAEAFRKYFSSGTLNEPINQGGWLPYYWCATQHSSQHAYEECITKGV